jgi:hypothetical protein
MLVHRTHKAFAKVFGPLGYCMYGPDHSKEKLTREPVIPRGLSGGIILRGSSCEDCRKKTHKFETECLAKNWKLFRTELDLELSDRRLAPTHGTITVQHAGYSVPLIVPLRDYPLVLTMPKIADGPALLTGNNTPAATGLVHIYDSKDAVARLARHKIRIAGIQADYNFKAAIQLLAKIAHGMMYVNFEMDYVQPLLLNIIVNDDINEAWKIIGATDPITYPGSQEARGMGMHKIRVDVIRTATERMFIAVELIYPEATVAAVVAMIGRLHISAKISAVDFRCLAFPANRAALRIHPA